MASAEVDPHLVVPQELPCDTLATGRPGREPSSELPQGPRPDLLRAITELVIHSVLPWLGSHLCSTLGAHTLGPGAVPPSLHLLSSLPHYPQNACSLFSAEGWGFPLFILCSSGKYPGEESRGQWFLLPL